MRRKELASLTVGQLEFDGPVAYAVLEAADEKNRSGSEIPLRADLVVDIRHWLAFKLEALQDEVRRHGDPIPARLPGDMKVFRVPRDLVKILDRDLKLAGIPKRDERGRTVDVHALRTSFCTHLNLGGVPLRTAQAAMRHSDPHLTANVYTDPKLLDVHGALDVLPALPLDGGDSEQQRATGTADASAEFAPGFAPEADKSSKSRSSGDNGQTGRPNRAGESDVAVNPCHVKENNPLTIGVNGLHQEREKGFEPSTSSLGRLLAPAGEWQLSP